MTVSRRFVLAATASAALCLPALAQQAAPYPSRPVRFVVPFATGGGSDTFTRIIAQGLTQKFGYVTVVENKPGAGGNMGAESALREAPDGYTLLVISGSYAGNAVVSKPNFDPIGAIDPVIQFTREPTMLAAGQASNFKNLGELVAEAKKSPGSIAYGSSGVGGLVHLSSEFLASVAGIKLTHVPYKGTGAAVVDLAGGQIQMLLGGSSSFGALAKAGKLRLLAVSGTSRLPAFPNVPTFAEQGLPDFKTDLWHGLVAPHGVPPAVLAKLNADINAVLRSPEIVARFAADEVQPAGGTPQQFGEVIKGDMERWRTIVKQADIRIQ